MKTLIRNLSARSEFGLVLLVGFVPVIACQLWQAIYSTHIGPSNNKLVELNIVELVAMAVVLWIGKIRGWSLATFGSKISWKGMGGGVFLFVVAEVVMIGIAVCIYSAFVILVHPVHSHPTVGRHVITTTGLTVPFILLHSIINPVFEEVLEAGYFIHSLQRFGMWPAILAGALFRAFYHCWLGIGALSIFAFGMIFGLAYWRWRQLWPIIVAHSLADFFGLLRLIHHFAHHAAS